MRRFLTVVGLVAISLGAHERAAEACGGCFVPPVETTQVTDHRMAFAISKTQTVLWDQIAYSGDPKQFAWVLPVRAGTKVEASTDAFFAALDVISRPTVVAPPQPQSGGGIGCGASATAGLSDRGNGVQVIGREVVGPYEAVTLRSSDAKALENWLTTNGFAIPSSIAPTIAAYVAEQFDFIALRLQPNQGIRSMRPVRVVYPGADNSLPLRMVAAGIGQNVAITLFVIGEGRYHPKNFPDATVDFKKLYWDNATARSNLEELSQAAMAENGKRGWLTDFAGLANVTYDLPNQLGGGGTLRLDSSYKTQCAQPGNEPTPLPFADAGDADGGVGPAPDKCDDLDVAERGMNPSDVWITRLRANLPANTLTTDLKVEAAPQQAFVTNIHYAPTAAVVQGGSCSASPDRSPLGTAVELAACAGALAVLVRRRRR
jgi:hypothetical protein